MSRRHFQKLRQAWPWFIACITAASSARADGPNEAAIAWRSDDGCASGEELTAKVTDILGDDSLKNTEQRFLGTATRNGDAWIAALEVTTHEKKYTRSVSVGSCETAVEVVTLLIALALDPIRAMESPNAEVLSTIEFKEKNPPLTEPNLEEEPSEPSAETTTSTAPSNASSEPDNGEHKTSKTSNPDEPLKEDPVSKPVAAQPKPTTDKVPSKFTEHVIGAGFVSDIGFADGFRPGLSLTGALILKRLHVELSVRYLPKREKKIASLDRALFESRLLGISTALGVRFIYRSLRVSTLLGVAANGLFAKSVNVDTPGSGTGWLVSLWAGVPLEWMVYRYVGVRLSPAIHFLPERPQFGIRGVGSVLQPYLVCGIFEIGVFMHF